MFYACGGGGDGFGTVRSVVPGRGRKRDDPHGGVGRRQGATLRGDRGADVSVVGGRLQRDGDSQSGRSLVAGGRRTRAQLVPTAAPLRLLLATPTVPLRRLRPAVRRGGTVAGRTVPSALRGRASSLRAGPQPVRIFLAVLAALPAISPAERRDPHVHGGTGGSGTVRHRVDAGGSPATPGGDTASQQLNASRQLGSAARHGGVDFRFRLFELAGLCLRQPDAALLDTVRRVTRNLHRRRNEICRDVDDRLVHTIVYLHPLHRSQLSGRHVQVQQ